MIILVPFFSAVAGSLSQLFGSIGHRGGCSSCEFEADQFHDWSFVSNADK